MKQILFFAVILCLAACSQQQGAKDTDKGSVQTPQNATDQSAVAAFETFLNTLPVAEESSVGKAKEYFHKNFDKNNKEINDKGLAALMTFHQKIGDTLSWTMEEDAQLEIDPSLEDKDQKPYVREKIKHFDELGFRIHVTEGAPVLIQRGEYFEKEFKEYFSPAMQEYMGQFTKENNQIWTNDGGLSISHQELADRTIWWEKFNAKYPGFVRAQENKNLQKFYLYTLLAGMDNTPAFEYQTNKLTEDFKKTYEYVKNVHPNTETNTIIQQYYQLLSSADFKKSPQVESFISKYIVQ